MRKPPPHKASPVEPFYCAKCENYGMRYQGDRVYKTCTAKIYKCNTCGRNTSNPKEQPAENPTSGLTMVHEVCGTPVPFVHIQVTGSRRQYRGQCSTCNKFVSLKNEAISRDEKFADYHSLPLDTFRKFKNLQGIRLA